MGNRPSEHPCGFRFRKRLTITNLPSEFLCIFFPTLVVWVFCSAPIAKGVFHITLVTRVYVKKTKLKFKNINCSFMGNSKENTKLLSCSHTNVFVVRKKFESIRGSSAGI